MQDGVLEAAGKIMNRMIELKGLSTDVMKNSSDNANYNREFKDLQQQLFDMGALKFNGVSLFATTTTRAGGTDAVFNNLRQDLTLDNTVDVIVSSEGNAGPKVSVNKSLLFSALTTQTGDVSLSAAYSGTLNNSMRNQGESNAGTMTFIAEDAESTINLSDLSVGVFTQAVQNLATFVQTMVHPCRDCVLHPMRWQDNKVTWKLPTGVLSMSISQQRVHDWPSTMCWFRHPHRCWHKPTRNPRSHSCYFVKHELI